jgi:hypothetical protein
MLCVEFFPLIRQFFSIPYIPIYFSLYPLCELNKDLGEYLNEDYFYGRGEGLTDAQLNSLKKTLRLKAYLNVIIGLAVVPIVCGFICSFFLPKESIVGFSLIFIAYKLIGIIRSAIDFRTHSIANTRNIALFLITYIIYFYLFLLLFKDSYFWTLPYVLNENWGGLFSGLLDLFLKEMIVKTILFGLLVTFIIEMIAQKKYRTPDHNIVENSE